MSVIYFPTIEFTQSFDTLYETASLEKFDSRSSIPLLSKVVSTLSSVKNNFDKWLNKYDYIQKVEINKRKLEKKLDNYNYLDLKEVSVYKPIGLTVPFIKLLETIENIQEQLLDIEQRLIRPYMLWSGQILNNPEKLQRLSVNEVITFLDTKTYNKLLDSLFDPNDVNSLEKFGKLFESNTQALEVLDRANQIIMNQNQLPPKKLLKTVDEASKRTEMLIRRCQFAKDSPLCSAASKKVIADVLYDMGVEVTLYSRLSYNIISTQVALTDSFDKIIELRQ